MIRAESLVKAFGKVRAVQEASFRAEDGRVTALLGPNGAGKSTCLRILSTVLRADSDDVLKSVGVLPHATGLYTRLTARENIAYFGELHGIGRAALKTRIDSLVEELEMGRFADRRVDGFSQGQRIKVALGRALVHKPRHLLLDEPTNGLDVMATRALREIILSLKNQGCCVLFSSHIMQEVTNLCDDVIVIGGGEVRFQGTLAGMQAQSGRDDLEEAFISMAGLDQ